MECSSTFSAQCKLPLLSSSDCLASTSRVAGITDVHHHTQITFIFLVEMGFHHVGQAVLVLPASSNLLTYAYGNARITALSHGVRPEHYS